MFRLVYFIFSFFIMGFSYQSKGQHMSKEWSVSAGYEANYSGNNLAIRAMLLTSDKHQFIAGTSYNLSDGFSQNPVLGMDLGYRLVVLSNAKWRAGVGLSYRWQKPISNVNLQTICLANELQFNVTDKVFVLSNIGYGVALERNASAGQFNQFNNLTGLINLGCGIRL